MKMRTLERDPAEKYLASLLTDMEGPQGNGSVIGSDLLYIDLESCPGEGEYGSTQFSTVWNCRDSLKNICLSVLSVLNIWVVVPF